MCVLLGIERQGSCMVGKRITTELYPSLFKHFYFRISLCCPGWLKLAILLSQPLGYKCVPPTLALKKNVFLFCLKKKKQKNNKKELFYSSCSKIFF